MPVRLTLAEKKIAKKIAEIKEKSGSHSPSPAMLAGTKGVKVKHDFCYLSNPHATELFLRYFREDFRNIDRLRSIVERYPSQSRTLAEKLETMAGISSGHIFVGNGATEIIQAVLNTFTKKKILVPVPTFSPYMEFAPHSVRVIQHRLRKKTLFKLNPNELLADVRKEKPDTVVIINPNNPDGGYLPTHNLKALLGQLRSIDTVIVDESFLPFTKSNESIAPLVRRYPNLVVIKSLSKDFGIAGLRLGYAVMSEKRVSGLLERGYLWNVSGFGEYFLGLLNDKRFLRKYEQTRLRAIKERDEFFTKLSKIKGLKVYPSKANAFLLELLDGSKAEDLAVALLARYGLYIRLCKDKVGLNGEFIRVASRTAGENRKLIRALSGILKKHF